MKKFLYIIGIILSLISCTDNQDNNTKKDPIIGKWYLYSQNGKEVSSCKKKNTTDFSPSGEAYIETYSKSNNPSCQLISNYQGNWLKNQDGTYTLKIKDQNSSIPIIAIFNLENTNTLTIINGSPTVGVNSILKKI
ncbi:hypothetical protein WH52_09950 [Tenacibaculum holothuriorum]|uniref:Lipocalin-like domain-containing protein n=1 Tax=Tenacibaculum holothuriorum TaxID=1635173 RepID=A0A1Y2PCK0_9FLAO|nr:lipocalin family protein [Tenacibaculum holothuriorum]OSY87741.1 hypothetical protein WH52_09950 [Tenacibaculum holothuriorum]